MNPSNPANRIALFQRKEIRRTIHTREWWFVIVDMVAALTDSVNPSDCLKKLRRRDEPLSGTFNWGTTCPHGLEFETAGGRRTLQRWNTEGVFRLFQSVPSPKADPFKLVFYMLGEAATWIARTRGTRGFPQNRRAARDGGAVAGNARRELEKKGGRKAVTAENYPTPALGAEKAKRMDGA